MSESLQSENEREWLFASIIEGVPGFLYCMDDAGHILASSHGFKEKIGMKIPPGIGQLNVKAVKINF